MKRVISFLVIFVMLFTLVACSGNTTEPQGAETSKPDSTDEKDTTSGTEQPSTDEYGSFAKVSGRNIYVNYKDGRRDDNKSSSIVFHNSGSDLTVLAFDATGTFSGGVTEVLQLINDGRILKDISSYSEADFHDYNATYAIEVKSTDNVDINGLAAQKFTGIVKSTDNIECYVYGYAFIIEGTPCVLAGFVLSEAQEQSLITSINAEVDTMIKMVRTER